MMKQKKINEKKTLSDCLYLIIIISGFLIILFDLFLNFLSEKEFNFIFFIVLFWQILDLKEDIIDHYH